MACSKIGLCAFYGHLWPNFPGMDIHSLQLWWAPAPCCLCCHAALSCSLASDHLFTGENLSHKNMVGFLGGVTKDINGS